ncbi:MAG: TetR/AcrR family transcriptional regulator [Oscillospiraceae bacterium]|jgi:AcrR family transcriptional regulator|nr:TetR/AcrR family transcriptional regulator [Oscillospiraceae bacterium]
MNIHTKNRIVSSCNALLRALPFEKITVSMIAKRSGVSKPTFYRYFLDKYDVVNYSYKVNLDRWRSHSGGRSWRDFFIKMYTASKADSKLLKNAYSTVGINSYKEFLFKYSYEAIQTSAIKCRGGAPLTREEEIYLAIFCYGVIAVDYEWINGNLDYTAKEMAELTYRALPGTLRDLWWNP